MYIGSNVTVMVSDLGKSASWYTDTLGLTLHFRAGDEWAEVHGPGLTIGLHQAGEGGPQAGPSGSVSIGLQTGDFKEALKRLTEAGVSFDGDPIEEGPVKLAFFKDPDGTSLYLCQATR